MSITDIKSLTEDRRLLRYLEILKGLSINIMDSPIKSLHSLQLFQGVNLPKDKLRYQEVADGQSDGFFTSVDVVGKRRRKEKKSSMNEEIAVKSEVVAKGQITPFPHNWSWNFSWTTIPHPNLDHILKDQNIVQKPLLPKQRKELVDHLTAELFFYFRKGIPTVYLEIMMRKLVQDFPSLIDGSSFSGYVSTTNSCLVITNNLPFPPLVMVTSASHKCFSYFVHEKERAYFSPTLETAFHKFTLDPR